MATSGRFLTTHVGSLPRPEDLMEMMWAREDGIPVDKAAMEERVARAVDEAVSRQTHAGIDIVNDGEWGKPSYATYIKDRLRLGGTGNTSWPYIGPSLRRSPLLPTLDAHRKRACNARSASGTFNRGRVVSRLRPLTSMARPGA